MTRATISTMYLAAAFLPLAWQRDAACVARADIEFFPEGGQSIAAARAVCARRSARDACLEYALVHEIERGVWGGTSAPERREARERGEGLIELLELVRAHDRAERRRLDRLRAVAVADAYADARRAGRPVRLAVAEQLGVPLTAAAKLIRKARLEGVLAASGAP